MYRQPETELGLVTYQESQATVGGRGESSWLVYVRMLGAITAASIGTTTVLHQVQSALRLEPTHWFASLILVAVSAVSFVALVSSNFRQSNQTIGLTSVCAITSAFSIALLELCDVHYAFFATVLLINATAFWFFVCEPSRKVASAPSDKCVTDQGSERETRVQRVEEECSDSVEEDHGNQIQESIQSVRPSPAWKRHAWLLLFGSGFVIYMVVVPTIGLVIDWFTPVTGKELTDMSLGESIRLHAVSGVVMALFLAVGASIGSFLNVVIYRLPRSMPLLWPPSACASCKTILRGKDNIPVVAWLKLGGQCRYCGTPISARYPVIEATAGLVFVLFYYRELLSGGVNLPVRTPNFYNGIVWILLYTKWDLVTIYLFHMFVLMQLLAFGMINYDRFRVPLSAALICCGTTLGLCVALPHLNPTISGWSGYVPVMPASLAASLAGCSQGAVDLPNSGRQ